MEVSSQMSNHRIFKRQKRTVGSIVKIPLEGGYHTYARILKVEFAFYDLRTKEDISDLEKIISSPILFVTAVNDYAITKGHWLKIGTLPIEDRLKELPPQYIQDAIRRDQFTIYYNDGRIEEATLEQCRGLESVSVWPPKAMEVRLNDYYAGRLNYHVVKMMYPELSHEEIKKRIAESSNKSAKKETVPQTKKIAAA